MRVNDPYRLAVSSLIGCAWRMSGAGSCEADGLRELGTATALQDDDLARACDEGARFWRRRADDGMVDGDRARRAAALLVRLGAEGAS